MKLDTLDKKPKVYNIAILTAVVAAGLAALIVFGGEKGVLFGCLVVSAYFLAVTVLLSRACVLQIRYNLYSYNTALYFGFALFTLFIAATYTLLFFQLRALPDWNVLTNALNGLRSSAKTYAIVSFPFLFVFSVALAVSNLSLIRHEGFRPVNLLGVALAVFLVGGEVVIFILDYSVSGSLVEVMLHDIVTDLMATVYLYCECMMLGTIFAGVLAARYEPEKDKDFIIVLGCAIRKDGTPTPLLRGRIDRALTFARAEENETGKAPVFVLSGGQGADEAISEAECMRRYLAEQGVPEERMLLEDRSTNTDENMRFSKEKIDAVDPDAKVAFSTTNYHVFRSGIKARRAKMRAQGMGAKTKWYFWPNASVREFAGLLTQHKIKQGLILLGLAVFYTVLTVLNYQVFG